MSKMNKTSNTLLKANMNILYSFGDMSNCLKKVGKGVFAAFLVALAVLVNNVPAMAGASGGDSTTFTQSVAWDDSAHTMATLTESFNISTNDPEAHEPFGCPDNLDVIYVVDMSTGADIPTIVSAVNGSFGLIKSQSANARYAFVGFGLDARDVRDFTTADLTADGMVVVTYSNYSAGLYGAANLINGRFGEDANRPAQVIFVSHRSCDINNQSDVIEAAAKAVTDTGAGLSVFAPAGYQSVMVNDVERFYVSGTYLVYEYPYTAYSKLPEAVAQMSKDLYMPFVQNLSVSIPLDLRYFELPSTLSLNTNYTHTQGSYSVNAAKDKISFVADHFTCGEVGKIITKFDYKKAAEVSPISEEATLSYGVNGRVAAAGASMSFAKHAISFDLNGGVGAETPASKEGILGNVIQLPELNSLYKGDQYFGGWNVKTVAGANVELRTDGRSFIMPDADVVATAAFATVKVEKVSEKLPTPSYELKVSLVQDAVAQAGIISNSSNPDPSCIEIRFQMGLDGYENAIKEGVASEDGSVKWWIIENEDEDESGSLTTTRTLCFGSKKSGKQIKLPADTTGKVPSTSYIGSLFGVYPISSGWSQSVTVNNVRKVTGLDNIDASKVTNLQGIFLGFSALEEIDLSSWDTPELTTFECAFGSDKSIKSINLGGKFNTKKVTSFNCVFYSCEKLESITFGENCTAENTTSMRYAFGSCYVLKNLYGFENFTVGRKCADFFSTFYCCKALTSLDLTHWGPCDNITTLANMFYWGQFETLDLCNLLANSHIADGTSLSGMFNSCTELVSLDWTDEENGTVFTVNTKDAGSLFSGCGKLTSVDLSGIMVDGSCSSLFYRASSLSNIVGVENIKKWKTTNASYMFEGTKLTTLDLTGFGADIVYATRMFCSCSNLTSLIIPDIGANVTTADSMFSSCTKLTSLDLTGFGDASKLTSMSSMLSSTGMYASSKPIPVYLASQNAIDKLGKISAGSTLTDSGANTQYVKFELKTPASTTKRSITPSDNNVLTRAVATAPIIQNTTEADTPENKDSSNSLITNILSLTGNTPPLNPGDPTEIQPGETVAFTVKISLDGDKGFKSGVIEITDKIPEGFTYVEDSLEEGGGSGIFQILEYREDGTIYAKVTALESSNSALPMVFTYQAEAPSTRPTVTTFYQEPAEYLYHGFSGESNLLPYYIKASESEVAPTVYTVTYENASVEGLPATAANAIPTSRKVLAGEKITLPDGLKVEGWRFTGWKQGDATVSGEQTISGDTTFTAQWEKVSYYDVTYSFSGTAGTDYPKYAELPESLNVADGNKVELTTPEAWTGWVFGGWKVNGTGTAVTEVTVNGAAVNVVGSWNKNTYSISYATSDAAYTGTLPTNVGAVAWGTTLNVPAAIESFKDDTYSYSFEGWKCDDITIVNGSYEMPMKSITITAQWNKSELPINRTLTLNNAKTSGGETTYQCLAGTAITIVADAAPVGKMFDKWSTISTGIADPYSKTTVFIMPDSDASIEATYKDHVHGNWTYTASGDELICTCGNENCTIDGSKVVFKLTADNAAYTGTPYAGASVTSEQMVAWTASGRVAPSVMYTGREGTSYTANTTAPTNVGKYTAIISEGSGADKCEVAVDFEIAKVALRITANDYEIPYGTDAVGNGVECSGFAGGETIAVLNGTLSYNFGEYTKTSHIGKIFVITPMGLTAENYEISFVSGTMIVIPNELAADQYIIRYKDCNDASFSGTLADGTPVIHSYGTATTLIGATRTGYTFGGWHLDADCADEAVTELGATAYTDDITLYAEWIANQYEIIYKDEGDVAFTGTLATETPEIHTYGTATTLKSATKEGFSFEGWYTSADCAGEAVTSISATAYSDAVVLYAKWTRPHKHIWSYTASGNVITAECSDTFGTCDVTERTLTLTAENATYDGNSHGAAFVESNFAGRTYVELPEITYLKMDAEGTFSIPIVGTPKNVGIYQASTTIDGATARTIFTIAQKEVTVPAIAGKVYNGNRLTADVDCSGKPYTVTKNEGGVEVGSYEVILTLTDTDDYKWKDSEEDSVTLTFVITDDTREYLVNEYSDSQGNKVSANPKQATYGAKIELTLLPAEGYGIATLEAKNASGSAISIASDNSFIMPQSDVTITAEFVPNTYTITGYFDENGNKVTTDVERAVKGTIVTLTITSAEGYTFKSLTVTDAAGNVIPVNDNKFVMPAANVIIKTEFNKDKPAPAPDPEPIIIIVPQTQPTENSGNEDASGTEETSGTDGTETEGTETEGSETRENADAEGAETVQETVGTNPITEKKDALVIDELLSMDTNGEAATEADKEAITEAIVEAIETAIAESGTKDFILKADEQTVTEQGIENKAYADAATEAITEVTKPAESKTVTLESAVIETLANAEEVESLTVMTSVADVEFDAQTIESINEQSDGSVQLVVTLLKEEIALNTNEDNKVYFDVSLIREDGTKITTFDGGSIKVTVPIPKACQNEPVVVVYTDSKGHYSPVNGVVNSDGTFTFITEHLSEYILMTRREAEEMYNYIYDFSTLKAHVEENTADSITIDWNQYEDADGYIIYGNYCNHDGETYKVKKLATITDPAMTEYTINGLEEGTNYKFRIKAYKLVNGEKYVTVKSHYVHAVTLGGKQRVTADIKIDQTGMKKTNTVTLKEGQTYTIDAERLTDSGKAVHHVTMHYESSDASVATVSLRDGKITATGKGTCTVLAIAENGLYEEIKVKVK